MFDAEITPRCSFAWKSILQARTVIYKGARWRIGDAWQLTFGVTGGLMIWEVLLLFSPKEIFLWRLFGIFSSLEQGTRTKSIDKNFFPSEANCIKSIPVSFQASEDLLIWPFSPDGSYTVRSAYRLLATASHDALPGTSNPDGLKQLRSGIWKLQVPNKVRHFMWWASGESLPTCSNLWFRHVLEDSTCSLCEDHPKDFIHCLWMCDHVKCIWFSNPTFNFPKPRHFHRFSDLVSFVLSKTSPNMATLFSMVVWCIWVRRNKIREGQQVWDVGDTVKRARDLLQEFWDVDSHQYRSATTWAVTKWQPPPSCLFKINFDGAVFANLGWVGLGVVIRDSEGQILAALKQKIHLPWSVDMVEALAARQALTFSQEISIFWAEVEGDSLRVISAVGGQPL